MANLSHTLCRALVLLLAARQACAADLFVLRAGVGAQNGASLASACNGPSDSDCSTNAASGSVVYLCDDGTGLINPSGSWVNANAGTVRWTGDCSAYGYRSRATVSNTSAGAYNLNYTGSGAATFDHIDFVGGHASNTDCVNINGTGSATFNDITVTGCTQDGVDIDALTGGFTFTNLTITGAKFNGLFCNNSRVTGSGFIGRSIGTTASNTDSIGIDDGCGAGTVIRDIDIRDQIGDQGGGIDLQDSTGTGTTTISGFYIKNAEGSGITATANAGTAIQRFFGGIVDGAKFGVYLKDTGGAHFLSNIVTINSASTELKIGDTGTSGDSMASVEVYNSVFGGGACGASDAATYWRDNASVTITALSNNRYCANGFFTSTALGSGTFAQWQAATSKDANSELTSDPGFVGGAAPSTPAGFMLSAGSKLAAAGTPTDGATDLYGDAFYSLPDIGAIRRDQCYRRGVDGSKDAARRIQTVQARCRGIPPRYPEGL